MTEAPFLTPRSVRVVLFDFHSTLIDQGQALHWLERAWRHAGRAGSPADVLGEQKTAELAEWMDRIWEHVREIDPHSERDLSVRRHREIYDQRVASLEHVDRQLADALYETMLETWIPYDDTVPTLEQLKDRGVRIGLVSNVGVDIRPVLERSGLTELFDAVVLSYEAGSVKPGRGIFQRALDALGATASETLMVGDSWQDDGGAAALGIRTLILPRTTGAEHGLDLVLRLVD